LVSSKNTRQVRIKPYKGPVGGWGSVKGVTEILLREAIPVKGSVALWRQNKPRGFACVSCSYGRPPHSAFEFCENGAKATAWEITDKRCSPEFFAEHTVIQIVTKLNRGALIHGGAAYLLPKSRAGTKKLYARYGCLPTQVLKALARSEKPRFTSRVSFGHMK